MTLVGLSVFMIAIFFSALVMPAVAVADCLAKSLPGAPKMVVSYVVKHSPPWYLNKGDTVDLTHPGVTPEILCEAAQKAGINITFVRKPWKRGLVEMKSGHVDATFHASYKKEREVFGVYPKNAGKPDASRSINNQRYIFFYSPENPIDWDGKTFRSQHGKPVGVSVGYAVIDDLKKLGIPYTEIRGADNGLSMVDKGRLSAMAEIENLGLQAIRDTRKLGLSIVAHPIPIRDKPYYLLISRTFYNKYPDLSEKLWNVIGEIAHGPRMPEIMKKYK